MNTILKTRGRNGYQFLIRDTLSGYFHLIILNLNLRGMLMNGIEKLFLELDDKEAMALAQFIKRLTWTEMR